MAHLYLVSLTEGVRPHTYRVWADSPGEAVDRMMRPTGMFTTHVAHAWDCPCKDRSGRQGILKELLV